jgi:hypothetical protein
VLLRNLVCQVLWQPLSGQDDNTVAVLAMAGERRGQLDAYIEGALARHYFNSGMPREVHSAFVSLILLVRRPYTRPAAARALLICQKL